MEFQQLARSRGEALCTRYKGQPFQLSAWSSNRAMAMARDDWAAPGRVD